MSSTVTTSKTVPSQGTGNQAIPQVLPRLPEKPIVTIQPRDAWTALNLRELWHYRELLYFLIWRDVKVRYKQTVFGVTWVVMQPLLSTIVFTILLGKLARVPSNGVPYPLLVFAGLLPWTFFSIALGTASTSLVANAHLITKIYFPRMLIPTAVVAARLLDCFISFIVLIGLMIFYHVPFAPRMFFLPLLMILAALLTVAVAIWTAAMNVKYRDVGVALPFLIQLLMFASPVVYPSSLIYEHTNSLGRFIFNLNPLVGIIDNLRALLLGLPFNWIAFGMSFAVTSLLLFVAAFEFRRLERGFADVV